MSRAAKASAQSSSAPRPVKPKRAGRSIADDDLEAARAASPADKEQEAPPAPVELETYKTYDGVEDVADEEEEDEEVVRQREANAYSDEILFDTLKKYLPSGKDGRQLLLLFIAAQIAMVVLLFYGFHHRDSTFDCCNMYVVAVTCLFVLVQLFYYVDWVAIDGDNPAWHRANLFVPCGLYIVIFFEWAVGMGGMLAHAQGIDLFGPSFSQLTGFSKAAFIICTILGLAGIPLMVVLGFAHRNNLGEYYYNSKEQVGDKCELTNVTTPMQGSFGVRGWVKRTAQILGVDTPASADKNLHKVVIGVTVLQVPFYGFAAATYSGGHQSNLPIVFLCLGAVYCVFCINYSLEASSSRKKRTRKWNRQSLFFGWIGLFVGFGTYIFVMSSVFFRDANQELWENIISQLDGRERVTFVVTTCLVFGLLGGTIALTILHQKGWCDGQRDLEFMIETLRKQEEEQKEKERKHMAYLVRMGLAPPPAGTAAGGAAAAPTGAAASGSTAAAAASATSPRAPPDPSKKPLTSALKPAGAPSKKQGKAAAAAAAARRSRDEEVSVSITQSELPGRVTRIVPVDEKYGSGDGMEAVVEDVPEEDDPDSPRRRTTKRVAPGSVNAIDPERNRGSSASSAALGTAPKPPTVLKRASAKAMEHHSESDGSGSGDSDNEPRVVNGSGLSDDE